GQGGEDGPGRDGPVIGAVRDPAGVVAEEVPLATLHLPFGQSRSVAGGDPPAAFAITGEALGIGDGVALLDARGRGAVGRVIAVVVGHEAVADAAQVEEAVRILV